MRKKIIGGIALIAFTLTFVFATNLKAQVALETNNDNLLAAELSASDCTTYCKGSFSFNCRLTQGGTSVVCYNMQKK